MENTKKCNKCQQEKSFDSFNKDKQNVSGLRGECRNCQRDSKKQWSIKNKEWIREYAKNPENRNRTRKIYKERYKNDAVFRERELEKNRLRRRLEPAKIKQRANEKFRRETNINYKLGHNLRARIGIEIRKLKNRLNIEVNKCAKTIELLGCSIFELKTYIESKFLPGMTWDNHGFGDDKWHIDHILPCASFDLTQESEQRKCFHYTNLQPLWQFDNLSKNDKVNGIKIT